MRQSTFRKPSLWPVPFSVGTGASAFPFSKAYVSPYRNVSDEGRQWPGLWPSRDLLSFVERSSMSLTCLFIISCSALNGTVQLGNTYFKGLSNL